MLVSAQGRAGVGSGRRAVDGREESSERGAWRRREHVHNVDSIAMNTWFLPDMTTDAYDSEATRSCGFGRVHAGARTPSASRCVPEQARAFPGCAHLVPTVQHARSRHRARPDVPPASSCKTKPVFYPCTPEIVRTVRRRAGAPCTRARYNTSSAQWLRTGAVKQVGARVVCVIISV